MTDEQRRADLERLRMKAASPEMVTVPKRLLQDILYAAYLNYDMSDDVAVNIPSPELRKLIRDNYAFEKAEISKLRKAAGIE